MAETAISAVLSKLGDLATSEATALVEVGDNVAQLRDRLEWLQAFVRDADRRRRAGTDDQLTRVWVQQTRNTAFDAEDALDTFLYEVDLESKGYQGWELWLRYLTGFYIQITVRHGLFNRIKNINTRLKQISDNQKEYKIEHTPLAPMTTSSTIAFSAWRHDVVGFDKDVEELKKKLVGEGDEQGKKLMFISILGESGVGKYTLADKMYFDMEEITDLFTVKVWYMMPPDSTTEHLLADIYKRVTNENANKQRKIEGAAISWSPREDTPAAEDIPGKIRDLLKYKKYLLVVSGISSKAMFNRLMACLPEDAGNGSRVVLVLDIESEEVAQRANSMNAKGVSNGIHLLGRLDEEGSGWLFCARAFAKEVLSHSSDTTENLMKMYCKTVHAITGGHPLAIVLLAGLLRFKERPGQWDAVLQQQLAAATTTAMDAGTSSSSSSMMRTTIERVFWESFENLPEGLKSCLLYFAAQPKDTAWTPDMIVRMWMAEGFIKAHKGKTAEEVGQNYLKELELRCLVQVFYANDAIGTKGVQVHRSLHGFLLSEAREAGFMEIHETCDDFVPPSVRRLSSYIVDGGFTTFTNKFSKLRSFLCWAREEDNGNSGQDDCGLRFLLRSKFLRVIEIKGLRIEELPSEICDMLHLRYLGVHSMSLKEIPPTVAKLLNLQTLDIRDTRVDVIPTSFWNIKTLRHVLAQGLRLPAAYSIDQQQLDGLQTLWGVRPAAGEEGEWDQAGNCPLHKMTKLRTLWLRNIENDKHRNQLTIALLNMHLLRHLELHGDRLPPCIFTGPGLQNLETIKLYGRYGWPDSAHAPNLRVLRPNLAWVDLVQTLSAVPQHIDEEFQKLGVRGQRLKRNTAYYSSGAH